MVSFIIGIIWASRAGRAGRAGRGRLERIPGILHCTRFFPETDPKPFGKDSGIARNEIYINGVVVTRIVSARCFKTGNRQTYEVQ